MSGFMETLTTLSQKLTKGEEYEALVKELAESDPKTFVEGQYGMPSPACRFCAAANHVRQEMPQHKLDCIWLRAKALVEE